MSMFHELMMKKKGMPERYQEVEYIESDGTQYIDTLIPKTTNVKCKLTVQSTNNSGNHVIFSYGSKSGQWFGTSDTYYSLGGGNNFSFSSTSKQDVDITIKYRQDINVVISEESLTRTYSSSGSESDTYRLFNVGSYASSCKVYSCEIRDYDNNRLVRNFIPVYDTLTQKYGMWESVQGKFYGNAGTGDFAGSLV